MTRYQRQAKYADLRGIGQRWAFSSKRAIQLIALSLALCVPIPAAAQQATLAPDLFQQFFDSNGDPLSDGGICVFEAGTSTEATTYLSSTIDPGNTQSNPILLNSAGRPASGVSTVGIWLAPGSSYKFVLKDFTGVASPTCTPDSGTTLVTIDHVQTVPGSAANVDITATAGENLAAGDCAYLSDGSGALVSGSWYKCDADNAYGSTTPVVGFAVAAIASGDSGTIRTGGQVTLSGPLSTGNSYYISTSPGEITTTAPTRARYVGQAQSTTVLAINAEPNTPSVRPILDPSIRNLSQGRCSLTSGTAITTSDVTAATTLYWVPMDSGLIALYSGERWIVFDQTQLSIAVPATTSQMYDVFIDYNSGTPAISLTAWASDSIRATSLTVQDNILVKTGDTEQRYVCSFRTTGVSGQTEDSMAKRYVWNYYNRVLRPMRDLETTNSWTYTTATWREANAPASNRLEFVVGVEGPMLQAEVRGYSSNDVGGSYFSVAVGLDSTTTPTTGSLGMNANSAAANVIVTVASSVQAYPTPGYHFAAWLEYSVTTTNTQTWYGDNNTPSFFQAGITGWIEG